MVKKMSKNKICIYATILIVIAIIAIPSTVKVVKKHNDRLLENTINKIIETAKDCYYNNSCVEENITLAELYEKTSLPLMNNPISKKIYNDQSYVSVSENFKFINELFNWSHGNKNAKNNNLKIENSC